MFSSPTQRANRRRFKVFGVSFLVLCAAGLAYCYVRPAIYLASGRIQINPGSVQVETMAAAGGSQGTNAVRSLVSEVQLLTSRPLLQTVLDALSPGLRASVATLGADPLAGLQAGLDAEIAPDTNVVEISSRAPDAQLAAALVNGITLAYKAQLERSFSQATGDAARQMDEELKQLTDKVQTKRRLIEDFRLRHNIFSSEPNDNEVMGRVKGQSDALNKANEKLAIAEGKVRAMSDALAAGKPLGGPARANAVLDNMEQRASAIREELSELGRTYTADYLAMDPKVRAQRARLAEMERQIVTQRQAGQQTSQTDQQAALAEAREEANAAREAASRLQQNMGASRGALSQFSARFSEFKTMQAELAPLEALLRDANQRNARLEAGDAARRPSVQVIEPAYAPREAWRPQYTRDAAIAVGGSLLAALLLTWLVELFNRPDPQPAIVFAQPPYGAFAQFGFDGAPQLLGRQPPPSAQRLGNAPSHLAVDPSLLAAPVMPRELLQEELAQVLANASPPVHLFAHLLLRGVSPEEAVALRGRDLDPSDQVLRVGSPPAREMAVDPVLHELLAGVSQGGDQALFAPAGASAAILDDLATGLLYAAHDAGIDRPGDVTPAALRHTFAAFLARQGIRMADLARAMGHLSSEQAALYSGLAPAGKRLGLDGVDRLMPAARDA